MNVPASWKRIFFLIFLASFAFRVEGAEKRIWIVESPIWATIFKRAFEGRIDIWTIKDMTENVERTFPLIRDRTESVLMICDQGWVPPHVSWVRDRLRFQGVEALDVRFNSRLRARIGVQDLLKSIQREAVGLSQTDLDRLERVLEEVFVLPLNRLPPGVQPHSVAAL